jgi:type I restriction enzyme R subunit
MKLRLVGEMLVQQIAARNGVFATPDESQTELLTCVRGVGSVPRDMLEVFHDPLGRGNDAIHGPRRPPARVMSEPRSEIEHLRAE